jgi:hypothetical protein
MDRLDKESTELYAAYTHKLSISDPVLFRSFPLNSFVDVEFIFEFKE